MLPEKQVTTNQTTELKQLREIGGAQELLAAYQRGERDFAKVNLENADLSQANLTGINLEKTNLKNANLCGTNLSAANLQTADLRGANLTQTNLRYAHLNGSDLRQAVIKQADLYRANLSWANLSQQDLRGANLARVDFQGADLSAANLSEANLNEAKLDAANLTGAILVGANLTYAYMPRVQLVQANLEKAQLVHTELTAANLQQCVLDRANLMGVRLRKAQLQQASLQKAYLSGSQLKAANLTNANLQKADLSQANLEDAILTQADLRGAEIPQATQANLELAILGELDKIIEQSLHLELKVWGSSFAFSPDSEMLAYTDWNEKIILVNANTGEQVNQIDLQSEPVVSVVFSADGKTICESLYVNELKLWNPLTGKLIQHLKNHSANYTSFVFNASFVFDGKAKGVAMMGTGEPFEVFDVGHETRTLKGYSSGILTQAHSPDGQLTARSAPDVDGQIELLDRQTGKRICLLTGHEAAVQSLAFSPDSQTLASKSAEDFKLWQIAEGKETYSCLRSQRENYPTIMFTQANHQSNPGLISSDFYASFNERKAAPGEIDPERWNFGGGRWSFGSDVTLSADGKVLARCYYKQPVQLWNLQTGEDNGVVNLDGDYGFPLALNSTGSMLAATGKGEIALWDVTTNKMIYRFTHDSNWIKQIVFSPDDRMLASGADDKTIKLWDLQTNCEIKTLQDYSSIQALAFSPLEPILASVNRDSTIRLWDLQTMEEIHSFKSDQQEVINLKFSPDGKFLGSSNKKSIRVWQLRRTSQS
ncbi:pentapeptide repeat-containing protein [Nostoc punctiforme FACHB-252]|uniref:Pentapeptide repeat-containing protein n=1 Tax=Nostoc punctiforme FACHB-252 TaxID=1357509 RepID=A0ABR8HBH7_NOSPU|nr:pentapeptide repeat-containing protein [Nostoc punctiforme]MBD2612659.1 pentapeptide repeat-containing protein [Nostoc punctiforme FACHB-252]